jgi:hypothetical protein
VWEREGREVCGSHPRGRVVGHAWWVRSCGAAAQLRARRALHAVQRVVRDAHVPARRRRLPAQQAQGELEGPD